VRHGEIVVVEGDLLKQDVDVIVNPANTHLEHMGGLAGAIVRAGGRVKVPSEFEEALRADVKRPEYVIQAESRKLRPVPTGGAVATTAGDLPFKAVVHAVGPIWHGGDYFEEPLLRLAHLSACAEAVARGATRVGFPAVSCGIFGFPVRRAAPIAVRAARDALNAFGTLELVLFALTDDGHADAFREALSDAQSGRQWWNGSRDACPRCGGTDVVTWGDTAARTELNVADHAGCEGCGWTDARNDPKAAEREAIRQSVDPDKTAALLAGA
jgi:O-acetyl-ADP-ribose deacetylase (regulator of RNase III)